MKTIDAQKLVWIAQEQERKTRAAMDYLRSQENIERHRLAKKDLDTKLDRLWRLTWKETNDRMTKMVADKHRS